MRVGTALNAGSRSEHRTAVAGLAVGGTLFGHWLTYLLLSPSAAGRRAMLGGSGHGYLSFANEAGLMLALFAGAALVIGRMARLGTRPRGPAIAARLATFQVVAFLAMEIVERLVAGSSLGQLGHVLPEGIAVQLVLALLAAPLIAVLLREVERAVAAVSQPSLFDLEPRPWRLPALAVAAPVVETLDGPGIRGPPPAR